MNPVYCTGKCKRIHLNDFPTNYSVLGNYYTNDDLDLMYRSKHSLDAMYIDKEIRKVVVTRAWTEMAGTRRLIFANIFERGTILESLVSTQLLDNSEEQKPLN